MPKQAFEGVKVADFTWAAAGPLTTKYLSDHGAEVIRVESHTRPDLMRTGPPHAGNIPGINRSYAFAIFNTTKRGITLNLNHPRGPEVARKLVAWADVVTENFAPGVMDRWELGYEELKKVKPDIIMVSSCMQGQTGPHSRHPGYGIQLTGLSGITQLTGWPDREPSQPFSAYTDFIVPRFAAAAIIAALDYRRRTGKGQYLDISQYEIGMQILAPLVLDYAVNRRIADRTGNRSSWAAPHAVYRCRGDDRWCAISVFSDEEWESFCRIIGQPEWTKETKFATLLSRKENEEELDRLINEWTINFSAEEVMNLMQKAGINAGVVETSEDTFNDPQIKHRHHFWQLDHPEMGKYYAHGPAFRLSKTPCELKPAPCLGQDNEYVYTRLLGMSHKEFTELQTEGVFE